MVTRSPRRRDYHVMQSSNSSHRHTTKIQSIARIHRQHTNGRSPSRRDSDQGDATPFKMLIPPVVAWIKEAGDVPANRIDPGQVRPFVQIAVVTREREI